MQGTKDNEAKLDSWIQNHRQKTSLGRLILIRIQNNHLNKDYDSLDHHLTPPRVGYASKVFWFVKGANALLFHSVLKPIVQSELPLVA